MAERKARSEANPLNFEKSLKQLEGIVKRLEDEELPLDQALKLFAEGQTLARGCETQLRAAENQVRQLLETPDGEITETPFESGDGTPDGTDDEQGNAAL